MEIEQKSHLVFQLNNESFAINVSNIQGILEVPGITALPQMPDYFEGVIKYNDRAVPVINTRLKMGLPKSEFDQNTCIIMLQMLGEQGTINMGAVVDAVEEVIEVAEDEVLDPPVIGTNYHPHFVKGMIKTEAGFTMILDVDEFIRPAMQNLKEFNNVSA